MAQITQMDGWMVELGEGGGGVWGRVSKRGLEHLGRNERVTKKPKPQSVHHLHRLFRSREPTRGSAEQRQSRGITRNRSFGRNELIGIGLGRRRSKLILPSVTTRFPARTEFSWSSKTVSTAPYRAS